MGKKETGQFEILGEDSGRQLVGEILPRSVNFFPSLLCVSRLTSLASFFATGQENLDGLMKPIYSRIDYHVSKTLSDIRFVRRFSSLPLKTLTDVSGWILAGPRSFSTSSSAIRTPCQRWRT